MEGSTRMLPWSGADMQCGPRRIFTVMRYRSRCGARRIISPLAAQLLSQFRLSTTGVGGGGYRGVDGDQYLGDY